MFMRRFVPWCDYTRLRDTVQVHAVVIVHKCWACACLPCKEKFHTICNSLVTECIKHAAGWIVFHNTETVHSSLRKMWRHGPFFKVANNLTIPWKHVGCVFFFSAPFLCRIWVLGLRFGWGRWNDVACGSGQVRSGLYAKGGPVLRRRRKKWKYVHNCYLHAAKIDKRIKMWSKIRISAVRINFWIPGVSWTAHTSSAKRMPGEQTLNPPMPRQTGNMFW